MICKQCGSEIFDKLKFVKSKGICKKCNSTNWNRDNKERAKLRSSQYYQKNKDKINSKNKSKRDSDPEKYRKRVRESYYKNKDYYLEKTKKRRQDNPEKYAEYVRNYQKRNKDKVRERERIYCQDNKELRCYYSSMYRANKKQATPKRLTEEQKEEIKVIYKECGSKSDEEGIKYHVDHIIPLKSDLVCGLHVPWNLQILTATENVSKHNKLHLNIEASNLAT